MPGQPETPNPPLPDDVCAEIGKHLQLTLVELIALSLAGKQLQWTAYGREFVSVHRHLASSSTNGERSKMASPSARSSNWTTIDHWNPASPKSDVPSSGCTHSSGTSRVGSANAVSSSARLTPFPSTCS